MATTEAETAWARVAELEWWHTIEVAPGVVTPGGWDLRPTAKRLPWPSSLAGMRCLDVGTMDGFGRSSSSAGRLRDGERAAEEPT